MQNEDQTPDQQNDQHADEIIDNPDLAFRRVETKHPYTKENLKTLKGRMNRLDFVILMFSLSLVTVLLYKYLGINPVSLSAQALLNPDVVPKDLQTTLFIGTLSVILFALLTIKRLHDIDYSGWVSTVFLAPLLIGGPLALLAALVGLILRLILIFAPGIPAANRFGNLPVGNHRNKILILIGILLVLYNIYAGLIEEASPYLDQLTEYIQQQQ